jgi:hypothetical protein
MGTTDLRRPTLYLLGGAARAGKSLLGQRLLRECRIPPFSLDTLAMGLTNGLPEFRFNPDADALIRGEKLWPIFRAMCVNVLETDVTTAFEGDSILPKHVAELEAQFPGRVRACFIGYASVSPKDKLRDIRRYGGSPNDWLQGSSDDEVLAVIDEMLALSRYLQAECPKRGLPYFDGSVEFNAALERAFRFLSE